MYDLKSFEPGDLIIAEGMVDHRLFVLQRGKVAIKKGEQVISELSEKGTVIGEISVILAEKRTCSVVAVEEADLLELDMSLDEIIEKNPNLTKRLLVELAGRLQSTTATLAETSARLLAFVDRTS